MMTIDEVKIFVPAAVAVFIALIAFIKGVIEYTKKNTLDRAEVFLELRRKFKETDNFSLIISYLNDDDDRNGQLSTICISDRLKFLGFFEEVALMVNSGLLDKNIANQSFGFYVQKTWESEYFWWDGNPRDSEYRIFLKWLYDVCVEIHKNHDSKHAPNYRF